MGDVSPPQRRSGYPPALLVFVGGLAVVAVVLAATLYRKQPPDFGDPGFYGTALVTGIVLHILNQLNFNVRFAGQRDNIEFTFSEAGLVASFQVLPPGVVAIVSSFVHLIRELQARRPSRVKVVFNTFEIGTSVALAGHAYLALVDPGDPKSVIFATVVAMVVLSVSNRLLVGTVISISTGAFRARYFHSLFVENLLMLLANMALGMTAVMAFLLGSSWLLFVPLTTLLVVYLGYQAYIARMRDANTLARLYETAFITEADSEARLLTQALAQALETFGTREVVLSLGRGENEYDEWRMNEGQTAPIVVHKTESLRQLRGSEQPLLLRHEGPRVARPIRMGRQYTGLAAPVLFEGQLIGVLTARKARAFDTFNQGDLRAFSLFASQLGIGIENARLKEIERQQQRLRQKALDAERNRISRDLHDSFVQTLVQIDLHLAYLQKVLEKHPERAPADVQELQANVQKGLLEVRSYMAELKPMPVRADRFVEDTERYLTEWGRQYQVETELLPSWYSVDLSDEDLTHLFQIIREALNNAAKHAHARRVEVRLEEKGNDVVASVRDDGDGFDTSTMEEARRNGHFGLNNIAERAAAIGGVAAWNSAPGRGTTVTITVPRQTAPAGKDTAE